MHALSLSYVQLENRMLPVTNSQQKHKRETKRKRRFSHRHVARELLPI